MCSCACHQLGERTPHMGYPCGCHSPEEAPGDEFVVTKDMDGNLRYIRKTSVHATTATTAAGRATTLVQLPGGSIVVDEPIHEFMEKLGGPRDGW